MRIVGRKSDNNYTALINTLWFKAQKENPGILTFALKLENTLLLTNSYIKYKKHFLDPMGYTIS